MKITHKNYLKEVSDSDIAKLADKFSAGHDFTKANVDLYNDSNKIKKVIDAYLVALNAELGKKAPAKKTPIRKIKAAPKKKTTVSRGGVRKAI